MEIDNLPDLSPPTTTTTTTCRHFAYLYRDTDPIILYGKMTLYTPMRVFSRCSILLFIEGLYSFCTSRVSVCVYIQVSVKERLACLPLISSLVWDSAINNQFLWPFQLSGADVNEEMFFPARSRALSVYIAPMHKFPAAIYVQNAGLIRDSTRLFFYAIQYKKYVVNANLVIFEHNVSLSRAFLRARHKRIDRARTIACTIWFPHIDL